MSLYKVMAVYSDYPKPFAECIGLFTNEMDAKDVAVQFEEQERTPNFMGCAIQDLNPVIEED
jgi:hypothetical protein